MLGFSKLKQAKPLLQVASSPANLWEKSETKICTEWDTLHNADKHDDMMTWLINLHRLEARKRSRKISQVKKQNIFTSIFKTLYQNIINIKVIN